jgi:rRNA pseudouridine-1189 N-methylase Emg1 (Nep1/Mra1 family)
MAISRKKLRSLQPALFVVLDGANLCIHPSKPRLLSTTDSSAISSLIRTRRFDPSTLNSESLHNALLYLQGTALNLSGLQRVFIRTSESPPKLISIDPRLRTPLSFNDFATMMHSLVKDQVVSGKGGERLMKFCNKDIANSIPPGVRRYGVYVSKSDAIVDPKEFVSEEPLLVYVNVNPEAECADEVLAGKKCLSNDALSCGMTAARVVRAVEKARAIW